MKKYKLCYIYKDFIPDILVIHFLYLYQNIGHYKNIFDAKIFQFIEPQTELRCFHCHSNKQRKKIPKKHFRVILILPLYVYPFLISKVFLFLFFFFRFCQLWRRLSERRQRAPLSSCSAKQTNYEHPSSKWKGKQCQKMATVLIFSDLIRSAVFVRV